MTLYSGDLKFLKAERQTDNSNGGGRATAAALVNNSLNELFPPLSELNAALGHVSLRKIFPAVVTANADVCYGAHIALASNPGDPLVDCVLFTTNSYTDTRDDVAAQLRYIVTGSNGGFKGVSKFSAATAANAASVTVDAVRRRIMPAAVTETAVAPAVISVPGGTTTSATSYTVFFPHQNIKPGSVSLSLKLPNNGAAASLANYTVAYDYVAGSATITGVTTSAQTLTRTNQAVTVASGGAGIWLVTLPDSGVVGSSVSITAAFDRAGYPGTANATFTLASPYNSFIGFTLSQLSPTQFKLQRDSASEWYYDSAAVASYSYVVQGSQADFDPTKITAGYTFYTALAVALNPGASGIGSIVGLPLDGKADIFKVSDIVLAHYTKTKAAANYTLGQYFSFEAGGVWNAVTVKDNNGAIVPSSLYSVDFVAQQMYINSLGGFTQPLTIEQHQYALSVIQSISGNTLTLNPPLVPAFPITSNLSSVLVPGNLAASVTVPFDQQTWTSVWSDSLIGNAVLAEFNATNYPIAVINSGAIAERWLILFDNATNFRLIGESVGEVATGTINANFSPNNPLAGAPYFTLDYRAWGSGWSAGNCLRFNTFPANAPVWLLRSVNPGALSVLDDNIKLVLRGSTTP